MRLTVEEQRMLNGEHGEVVQKMMGLLVAMGEAFDATRMIPVNSVHVPAVSLSTLRRGGKKLIEDIADSGARVKSFTTVNPSSIDESQWQELDISETDVLEQSKVTEAIRSIGAVPCYTCTPYLIGNLPRLGQHIAWGDSSAVVFANSVLGARTNPEGGPSALASALTGRTPLYGLHLDEDRAGKVLVLVKAELKEVADYGALGYWIGDICKELVPVFVGIPPQVTTAELKMLSNGIACICSPALFHAVGITPEARSEEQALGGQKAVDILEFGEKELSETILRLSRATTKDVSWVALGCPHCSISEVREIATLLDDKRVNSNVELWVFTSRPVKALSDRMGCTEVIERAKGRIVCETCPLIIPREAIKKKGFQSIATNSSALATYITSVPGITPHLGRLKRCVDAAVSGAWW